MTHRDLCRYAARWMISAQGRNLHAAAYEIACDGGVADALGISCPDPAADVAFRAREYQALRATAVAKMERRRKGKREPMFTSLVGIEPKVEPRHHRQVERHGSPVVAVAECKVSRGDLLADLGERKMLRYERAASECWLFVSSTLVVSSARMTCARLDVEHLTPTGIASILESLAVDGLPATWGVAVAIERLPRILRDPVRRDVEPWEVVGWSGRIAASYAHRALYDLSPLARELS